MFSVRNKIPEKGNKYYNTISNGGYNKAIVGKPEDKGCNVLANCVGYANGRFAEVMGFNKIKYQLICNAEVFIKKAKGYGLDISNKPITGGIMVWEGKGNLAGHVAFVERVLSDDKVYTSESSYKGKYFFNATRKKGNGNYGLSSNFKYLGCIINPYIKEDKEWIPGIYELLYDKAIRKTHDLGNNILKVKNCTDTTKKVLTSKKLNDKAKIKKGILIKCRNIYNINGRIWGSFGNCYVVLCNIDGTSQAKFIEKI